MVNLNQTGKFIAECRKKKQLTQKQLGEKLHVTDRAVSKWENGKAFPDCPYYGRPVQGAGYQCERAAGGQADRNGAVSERDGETADDGGRRSQLYGFQIIIYILMFSFITAFQLLLVLKGDGECCRRRGR